MGSGRADDEHAVAPSPLVGIANLGPVPWRQPLGFVPAPASLMSLVLAVAVAARLTSIGSVDGSTVDPITGPTLGITLGLLLVVIPSRWWVILVGAGSSELVLATLVDQRTPTASLGLVAATVAGPLIGALVVRAPGTATATGPIDLVRRAHLWRFIGGGVLLAATVAASITAIALAGDDWSEVPMRFGQRSTSDALVVLLVAGATVLAGNPTAGLPLRTAPALIILGGLAVATIATFAVPDSSMAVAAMARLQLLVVAIGVLIVTAEATAWRDATRRAGRLEAEAAHEHRSVERLQRLLLPPARLDGPHFGATGIYQAAMAELGVGGDWYDVATLADGRVLISVGDIVGHNLGAARAMSRARTVLPVFAADAASPAEVLERLDGYATEETGVRFATVWIGIFEPDRGRLTYTSAGHPPGFLLIEDRDGTRQVTRLDEPISTPIGLGLGSSRRPEATLVLDRPCQLVLYTDGLIERRGESLDQGLDRLERALTGAGPGPTSDPGPVFEQLMADSPRDDDAVLLWAELVPAP